MKIRTEFLM